MDCDSVREAISARIDGADPGLTGSAIDAHLADCAACEAWQQRAHALTRRVRLGGAFLDHDLTTGVLAALADQPAGPRRARETGRAGLRNGRRVALAILAVAQLAITIPLLVLGQDHAAGAHAAHELGCFDLALAIAFAVGALRPALSAGLAWPSAIAASGLLGTAVIDVLNGATFGADEAQHLIAVAGAALLCWQAHASGAGHAESALTPSAESPALGASQPAFRLGSHDVPASSAPRAPQPSPGGDPAATAHPGYRAVA